MEQSSIERKGAVVVLSVVAIIEATNEALKGAPNLASQLPKFVSSGWWNFVPIILLTILLLFWILRAVAWLVLFVENRSYRPPPPPPPPPRLNRP